MRAVVSTDGVVHTVEKEAPVLQPHFVLVDTVYSAISPGTEMSMQKNVQGPFALGYSAAGIVREVGEGVSHLRPGDRVACYGAPFVKHASLLAVPKHLAAPLPPQVSLREASFAGLGAIAIHALRQAQLQFGERVVVVGLGILGQIIAQVAHAAAYTVIGYDLLPERCAMLRQAGIEAVYADPQELEAAIRKLTNGEGADAVLLCAGGSATDLIDKSLGWLRDRGKVVIVGDLKMEFDRERMFTKEAEVLISRAGGPGRYARDYEVGGFDYPLGYVRWTEGRNVAEYVRLLAAGRIRVEPLISAELPMEKADIAYARYKQSPKDTIGVVLRYADASRP